MTRKAQLLITEREGATGLWASVTRAPLNGVGRSPEVLNMPAGAPLQTFVELAAHGGRIRDELMRHTQICKVLNAIRLSPAAVRWNILFEIAGAAAEEVRWETLQDSDNKHVAIDIGKRLFRVACDPGAPDLQICRLPSPIVMVAVLSPAGVDAQSERAELESVLSAVDSANAAGLPMELTVFLSNQALIQELQGRPHVDAKPVPGGTLELQSSLRALRPHLLHFFCHGATQPLQELQFATTLDNMRAVTVGSVLFSIDRLVKDPTILQRAWVVLFNCCDGGKSTSALNSMAFRTVAEAGVPAAVGMGAPLPTGAAPIFSKAFYAAFVKTLEDIATRLANGAVEVDFGDAIIEGRMALHDAVNSIGAPENCWSLPLIYLHPDEFLMQKPPARPSADPPEASSDAIAARVDTIANMLRSLPASTPPEVRRDMVALFESPPIVPPELRCDGFGQFSS